MTTIAIDKPPLMRRAAGSIHRVRDVDQDGTLGFYCRGHIRADLFAGALKREWRFYVGLDRVQHGYFRIQPDGQIQRLTRRETGAEAVTYVEVARW